jgi:hypothetical protein
LRRRDSIWLREARYTIELLPRVFSTTISPFFIPGCGYFPAYPFYYSMGHISLEEGVLFIEDLVILSVISLPTSRRFILLVSNHLIYRLAFCLNGLVVIF